MALNPKFAPRAAPRYDEFRIRHTSLRRYGFAGLLLLVPVLLGCSAGRPSAGFVNARLMDAYIPLSERRILIFNRWAAGFAIAPHVGVTNDHNLGLIPPERVLARSRDYDLLFFRTDVSMPATTGAAQPGTMSCGKPRVRSPGWINLSRHAASAVPCSEP